MSQQQTVLRVQTNIINDEIVASQQWYSTQTYYYGDLVSYNNITYICIATSSIYSVPAENSQIWGRPHKNDFLDLYSDIPIKINKSFAELQDISKKNTDYSIGLTLPGTKKNNQFFENFFNVDTQSLYFNATKRTVCQVLLSDESIFRGFMKLNKVSVINSKVEYDVTLYSTVANIFGQIGNNLLKDLPFSDFPNFNHEFGKAGIFEASFIGQEYVAGVTFPSYFIYPVVHNGYDYVSGTTQINVSGDTLTQTRFYTSTTPISGFSSTSAAYAAGVYPYSINSPITGLRNNQLKPALSVWWLIKLIFYQFGYEIVSDFFNTPWMKGLFLYGYFSSEATKFSYKINNIEQQPPENIDLITIVDGETASVYVTKFLSGIPCYCLSDIAVTIVTEYPYEPIQYEIPAVIKAGTTGVTVNIGTDLYVQTTTTSLATISAGPLRYLPQPVGTTVPFIDGDYVDFNKVIDENIKQIDILSSIAKKFNLLFIADPDNPNKIIIEPYDFYVGTGNIYDWTDKISYDKGWSVEPALNFVESQINLTDLEDSDDGNKQFKERNNRIYGSNKVYNVTDFKSQEKTIDTIFSPELIRKWDANIGLPLGINYVASNQQVGETVDWLYKGIKTKPKLFFSLGAQNPFIDTVGEVFPVTPYTTYNISLENSGVFPPTGYTSYKTMPVISHTMPMGNSDENKQERGFENDSLCLLFNSEKPTDITGAIQTYNTYTERDAYNVFYNNRITNIYNPNTRFLTGYFNLKYNDVKNLRANDIIKIQEQYFTWNKISEFNLTNRELTKVELIQTNVNPQTYPTRYFAYYYCDNPSTCYKFKTDFTNPKILYTYFAWSIYYDHQIGSLGGQTSGFTSSISYIDSVERYVPYTIYEITADDYNTSICSSADCDPAELTTWGWNDYNYRAYYWVNSGATLTGLNLFNNCSEFTTAATTNGITVGSSSHFGSNLCPTPTPTPSITPTNTVTPTITPTTTPTPTPDFQGQYMMFAGDGGLYQSSDYGITFGLNGTVPTSPDLRGASMSTSGQYRTTSQNGGYIWRSADYGSTWTSFTGITSSSWTSISMSANGQYRVATRGATPYLYLSTDYGVSWSSATAPASNLISSSISDNGLIIVLGQGSTGSGTPTGKWWISTNGGSSFTSVISSIRVPALGTAMSSNGQYIALGVSHYTYPSNPSTIYVSSDYGATFGTVTPFNFGVLTTVSMSKTGKYILVGFDGDYAYLSTDYGATFNSIASLDSNKIFRSSAISTSGKYMMLDEYTGSLSYGQWVSSDYGATWNKTNAINLYPYGAAVN